MNDEIVNINEIIHKTFKNITVENSRNANKVVQSWNSVLSKIKSYNQENNPNEGQNLIDHTSIIDLKNGILLVEADHPGWISLLQFHKKFILKGMQMAVPEAEISSLAFRLRGSKAGLGSGDMKKSADETRKEIEKRIEVEENNLKNTNIGNLSEAKNFKTSELAPELAQIFEDLKKSMLTNSKK